MKKIMSILKYGLFAYLIYIFIFAFLIFIFPPKEIPKEDKENIREEVIHPEKNLDQLALIENAPEAISVRLDMIEKAKEKINLAYYRWSEGKVSDLILGELLDAADRGVEVNILLDGIIQLTNRNESIEEVFKAFSSHPNIKIRLYEPFHALTPIAWNYRLHDKMMLVDEEYALMGGRNIQDRFYLDDADELGLVQDREVFIYHKNPNEKSVIQDMAKHFDDLWTYEHTEDKFPKESPKDKAENERTLDKIRASKEKEKEAFLEASFPSIELKDWTEETVAAEDVQFVSNAFGRLKHQPKVAEALMTLAEEAEESIFIQSPYFVPSKRMLKEVQHFDTKAEITSLFTNSKAVSPNLLAMAAYTNHREGLVDSGARIVEYQGPGSTHAKSSIFDEKKSVVGTFNVDPRSTYINTESMLIIDSPDFAEDLKKAIAIDFSRSLEVDEDYSYKKDEHIKANPLAPFKKFLIRLLSFFAPLFENLL